MNQFHLFWCKWKRQKEDRRGNSKTTPKREIVLQVVAALSFLTDFSLVSHCILLVSLSLLVAWGLPAAHSGCTGSPAPPGWHIHTCRRKKVCCVSQQSQECGGDTRRRVVTRGDLDRTVEGQQPSSRTGICSFVRGGTGGALPEPYKMTSSSICQRTPDLAGSPLALCSLHRWEQVHN